MDIPIFFTACFLYYVTQQQDGHTIVRYRSMKKIYKDVFKYDLSFDHWFRASVLLAFLGGCHAKLTDVLKSITSFTLIIPGRKVTPDYYVEHGATRQSPLNTKDPEFRPWNFAVFLDQLRVKNIQHTAVLHMSNIWRKVVQQFDVSMGEHFGLQTTLYAQELKAECSLHAFAFNWKPLQRKVYTALCPQYCEDFMQNLPKVSTDSCSVVKTVGTQVRFDSTHVRSKPTKMRSVLDDECEFGTDCGMCMSCVCRDMPDDESGLEDDCCPTTTTDDIPSDSKNDKDTTTDVSITNRSSSKILKKAEHTLRQLQKIKSRYVEVSMPKPVERPTKEAAFLRELPFYVRPTRRLRRKSLARRLMSENARLRKACKSYHSVGTNTVSYMRTACKG